MATSSILCDIKDVILSHIMKTFAILDLQGDKYPYFKRIQELPPVIQKEVFYEYENMNPRKNEEEFLKNLISRYEPFSPGGGWLYAEDGGPGMGYIINSHCFRGDTELYYCNNEMFFDLDCDYSNNIGAKIAYENMLGMLRIIELYSSGIGNIYIHGEDERDGFMFHGEEFEPLHVKSFRFRLDPSKIKKSISIEGGQKIPTSQFGGYFLPIPKVGKFCCELGEVVNGKRVAMLFDDYDIK